ncbi:MAG: hypothetical protein EOO41_01640, partial [Methanobacteriota archaeon]
MMTSTIAPELPSASAIHELMLDSVYIDAPFASSIVLCAQCSLPGGLDNPPELCDALRSLDLVVQTVVAAPTSVAPVDTFVTTLEARDGVHGPRVVDDNSTVCTMSAVAHGASAGESSAPAHNSSLTRVLGGSAFAEAGVVNFTALQLSAQGQSSVQLRLSCSRGGVEVPIPTADAARSVYVLACPAGYITPMGGVGCTQCPDGTYSDGVGEPTCTRCPSKLSNCVGGRIFFRTEPLFIEPSSITYVNASTSRIRIGPELDIYPCWNDAACVFDASARTFACAHGYSGPLCGVCDASANYVQQGEECVACPSTGVNILVFTLLLIALMVGLTYLTVIRRADPNSKIAVLVRISLTYMQMLGSLGIFKARGTATFRSVLGLADTVSTSLFASAPVACLLRTSFYVQFGLMLGLPLIAMLLGVLIKALFTIVRSCSCSQLRQYVATRGYIAPAVVVLYATYPMLVSQAFRALSCRADAVAGVYYLADDLGVECWTPRHVAVVISAACALVLFGVGIPILIVTLLHRRRHKLDKEDVASRFGFLYTGYDVQRGMYWWEALVLMRKAAIVLLGSVISDSYLSTFTAILVTFIAFCLHTAFQPYRTRLFNLLEGGALVALCITQILCMLYLRGEQLLEGAPAAQIGAVDAATTALLLLLNMSMFMVLGVFFARFIVERYIVKISAVADRFPRAWRCVVCACPWISRMRTASAPGAKDVDAASGDVLGARGAALPTSAAGKSRDAHARQALVVMAAAGSRGTHAPASGGSTSTPSAAASVDARRQRRVLGSVHADA